MVAKPRFQFNAVRPVVSHEVRVFTVATVTETSVGSDLPLRLVRTHGIVFVVHDVTLARFVV